MNLRAATVHSKATIKIFEHHKLYLWVENCTFYNFKELDLCFIFYFIFTQIAKNFPEIGPRVHLKTPLKQCQPMLHKDGGIFGVRMRQKCCFKFLPWPGLNLGPW